MNLVGKIFTVLIFFMCVVFGTFALMVHAAHKNWREVIEAKGGLNEQLKDANSQIQELKDEKKILEVKLLNEKDQLGKRLIALQQAAEKAVADKTEMAGELQKKENEGRVMVMTIQGISKTIDVLQTEIAGMRNDIKTAVEQRDATQTKLVKVTDDVTNAVAERDRLQKLGAELAAQKLKLEELLKYVKIPPNIKEISPPGGLQGEVTAVPRPDVVEISIGADDGVLKGHKFDVIRPSTGKYIGVIEVTSVDYPNRAVCRPDKARQLDQIQKGDHVQANTKPR